MAEHPNANDPPPNPGVEERGERQPVRKAPTELPHDPTPEEVPELLGERSDYPLSRE